MKPYQRIIETATRLFHRQGYNSTGINQIIEEAQVAKGSFYYNFKSKQDVCIASLNARHDYWFGQLQQFISDHSEEEPIICAFSFLSKMNEKEAFRGCSFLNILSEISADDGPILDVIQSHKNDLRAYIASLLPHKDQADHVYLLFESAIIESQLFKQQWPVEKAKNIVTSLIT